ncbi:Monoamine oxidase [Roseateles sp. YR242]|nr:Monoamine oxidase [Roseateles sp. YR242]
MAELRRDKSAGANVIGYMSAAGHRAMRLSQIGSGRAEKIRVSTLGREMPLLNPQSLGRYFSEPIGHWDVQRPALINAIFRSLQALPLTAPESSAHQLHLECSLHWRCLSQMEQSTLLDRLVDANSNDLGNRGHALTQWIEHSLLGTSSSVAASLKDGCNTRTRKTLAALFEQAGQTQLLASRFPHLRMKMPIDHFYDYAGFIKATGRVYGHIPPEIARHQRVLVVGGGATGITVLDGLNRMGVPCTLMEQADHIGGRLATVRKPSVSGRDSPTPMEMGAMRFHDVKHADVGHTGNSFGALIQHYGLPIADFPNPTTVRTALMVGGEVILVEPGDAPNHDGLRSVKEGYERVEAALFGPMRAARAAGDTQALHALRNAHFQRFNSHSFRSGMATLLQEQKIEWDPEQWRLFGAVGIGVGGYKGYEATGFLEEFKFLADQRLEDHVFLPGGANSVLHAMIEDNDLPQGRTSLAAQQAIRCGHEVTNIVRTEDGYKVHFSANGVEDQSQIFTDVIFTAGPFAARSLNLTGYRTDSLPLMSPEKAAGLKGANLVNAIKLAVKVDRMRLDELERQGMPMNVQSDEAFQQIYVLPAASEEATSRTIFLSYQLGDNANQTSSLDGDAQFAKFVDVLRKAAGDGSDTVRAQLGKLAELIASGQPSMEFKNWGQDPHLNGAFVMDRPFEQANTQALWDGSLQRDSEGILIGNEMSTGEGGFASGAVSMGINLTQQYVVRLGGTLPPNSPLDQERLYAPGAR